MERKLTPFERLFHALLRIWREQKNRKRETITWPLRCKLAGPAIFWKQDTSKEAQRGILRPVDFRLGLTIGLAFSGTDFKLPTVKLFLSGAGHIQCEVFFHWVTSWIEVGWLIGIPTKEYSEFMYGQNWLLSRKKWTLEIVRSILIS